MYIYRHVENIFSMFGYVLKLGDNRYSLFYQLCQIKLLSKVIETINIVGKNIRFFNSKVECTTLSSKLTPNFRLVFNTNQVKKGF